MFDLEDAYPNIFSSSTKKLREYADENFYSQLDASKLDEYINFIHNLIKDEYNNDDNDIEDFYDIIIIINNVTYDLIINMDVNPDILHKFLRECRIFAKKQVKEKFRDVKYKGRKIFSYEEADRQYFEGVKYVWEPSVQQITQLYETHRVQNV
jgi:hypothetical protein